MYYAQEKRDAQPIKEMQALDRKREFIIREDLMMKKRIIATLLTAVMAISLMACGGGSSSASTSSGAGDTAASGGAADAGSGNAEYTIKIGHSDTTTNLIHVSLENFAAYVNEQSGGKVKVDIYAAEQLGSNAEVL